MREKSCYGAHIERKAGVRKCALPEKTDSKSSRKRNETQNLSVLRSGHGKKLVGKAFWRKPTDAGMRPDGIVKALNIREDGVSSLASGIEARKMHKFAFEAAKEVLGHSVVVRIALAGHALYDVETPQLFTVGVGGVLDAAVGMEDQAMGRLVPVMCHA